ncbi:MAG TPA: hypothetical protein VMS18_18125 [Candidatus Binatia bacterium]|nr:hypothetical protein [Candidatus Binatia bacterium]
MTPQALDLVDILGVSGTVPKLLGLPYFQNDHQQELETIALCLCTRNRSLDWLEALVRWAKQDRFWSKRLHTGTRAVQQLARHLASGEISQQFDSALELSSPGVFEPRESGNAYLLKDYRHEKVKPEREVPTIEETMASRLAT